MTSDVAAAVSAQNLQVSAGQIGGNPAVGGQQLNATVNVQSRLQSADQFKEIILTTAPDGAVVRLSDVARVELGAENYDVVARYNGHPAAGLVVQLAPGANALNTVALVKAEVEKLRGSFPAGTKIVYPVDNTTFVKLSIRDVIQTLIEAILLVVVVMFIFLQNWRSTLIPAIAVPVVLLGVFGVLAAAGYSITTLTLFAMVLAIGLLVDDAIIVVENVQRLMDEEGLSPKDATIKSLGEITGALIGIGLILSAVFVPMAFFSGATGAIYRQFAVTIIAAVVLSVVVALVLTPALCTTLLKPVGKDQADTKKGFFGWFNRTFTGLTKRYERVLDRLLKLIGPAMLAFGTILAILVFMFLRLPSGFLPDEDQGAC